MIDSLALYWTTLLALILVGPALSLTGTHLAARNLSLQSLVLGQASTLGIVLGLALKEINWFGATAQAALPTILGLFFGLLFGSVIFIRPPRSTSSRSALYLATFSFLMAISALVTSLLPTMDSHMVNAYFGDVATATSRDGIVVGFISLVALVLHRIYGRVWLDTSFWSSIFQTTHLSKQPVFMVMSILLITVSIQAFGLMLTLSFLLIPTSLIGSVLPSPWGHLRTGALFSAIAGCIGLIASLAWPQIATTPTIVIVLALLTSLPRLAVMLHLRG